MKRNQVLHGENGDFEKVRKIIRIVAVLVLSAGLILAVAFLAWIY
ncbi:MAG: hypothetical protein OXU23_15620 [Candidatus Poribacteria bacterium]|nr:hypothetical protein [Candidatus Poribacteria bacterium]